MTKLPLLARIHVAMPCTADWKDMTGDDRVRHCAHCKKDVFNLSDMSRAQAERLIIEKNGDLCARYYQRKDGTILLADCSVGIKQKRKTRVLAAGAVALLAGTAGTAGYVRLSHHHAAARAPIVEEPIMGTIAVVQPEPPPPDVHEMKGQMIRVQAPPPPVAHEVVVGDISIDPREQQAEAEHAQLTLNELKAKQAEQVHAKMGKLKAR